MKTNPVALLAEPKIRNCRFKYECDMHWNDLKETGRPHVRFCETCSKEVHFVKNRIELALAIQNGLCVCVPHDIFDQQEKAHIRSVPKTVSDPVKSSRNFEVTLGILRVARPDEVTKAKDISEIPAWLRKQMD